GRVVVELVLDELEAGEADGVEGEVIGAAGAAHRQRRGTEVVKRDEPFPEDRNDRRVLLTVDAPHLSGAVVEVEVRRELLPLRLERDRPARGAAHEFREVSLCRMGRLRARGEV